VRRLLPVALAMLAACSKAPPPIAADDAGTAPAIEPPASAMPEAPPEPSPLDIILAKSTMADALVVASPLMEDKFDESSPGTLLFAAWAAQHLRWQDVDVPKNETSIAKVQKDVDAERMKRLCFTGRVVQIQVTRASYGAVYAGLLESYSGNLAHFYAVQSTGDLVADHQGRLCGVVTGRYDYKNSGGGSSHAIDMVGMFNLPENHPKK
jgi:hypothetical protein